MKHNVLFLPLVTTTQPGIERRRSLSRLTALTLTILFAVSLIRTAYAQSYTAQTLHSFGKGTDGYYPKGNLINSGGIFYGTTSGGGTSDHGTIFSIDPSTNTEKVIYNFQGGTNDGVDPEAGLIDINGILYGTTRYGGVGTNFGQRGYGIVFAFDLATHTEKVLHIFQSGAADGSESYSSLIAVNGILYGATASDGTNKAGIIFSIHTDGMGYQVIYNFGTNGTNDGNSPWSELVNVDGTFYGITRYGGVNGVGTIFSLDPATKTVKIIYAFRGGASDGAFPLASLHPMNGILYGTTPSGGTSDCGTIFSIDPSTKIEKVIYNFQGGTTDGAGPRGGLIDINGILYGTTSTSGVGTNYYYYGTAFSFDPTTHIEKTLYSFTGLNDDGDIPISSLIEINHIFYGITLNGGTGYSGGTFFSLTPAPPIAHNDNGRTAFNTLVTIPTPGVLGNDENSDDSPMTASLVTNPSHGTINFHSDGSFTYVPKTGYLGTDSFTYQAVNARGKGNVATCTLTVQARTPVAGSDSGRTSFNTPMVIGAPGVLGNDKNGDNTTMTASLVTNPSHGTITFNSDGSFKYVPTTGFLGTDSFTYQAINDIGKSNITTCTLLVQARTPIAYDDHGRVQHNTTAIFAAPAVLGNDYPGDTGTITATLVTVPSHGTITFKSDGSFKYTPTIGYSGTDSFTYKDTNAIGTSNTATCTLTVQ